MAAILCTERPDVIRKEAWSFYRTISGVSLCWELDEPEGPKGGALCGILKVRKVRFFAVETNMATMYSHP